MVTDTKIPKHKILYETLKKHILGGVYREGDLLPSENELCSLYSTTRPTVRQSLSSLAANGYIIRHQGKGSIVKKLPREIGILSISGTTSAVGHLRLNTRLIVRPAIRRWPADFMFPLSDLEKESGCVYMERLRLIEDEPVFYDINYIDNINLPRITARQFEDKSLFSILREHYNIEITGGEQRIRALQAPSKIARYLKMKPGIPLLHLERKIETSIQGLFLYSSIYCNTAKYSIFGRF